VQVAAVCVTLKVEPAIVSVPVRLVLAVFASTSNATLPSAVPLAPLVTAIQLALLTAVQAQPAPLLTVLFRVPPAAVKVALAGAMENVQLAAAWVTVNAEPAIVSVPDRPVATVFVATLNATLPAAVPLAPLVTVIQLASLTAAH
jgi:hypothetical protein